MVSILSYVKHLVESLTHLFYWLVCLFLIEIEGLPIFDTSGSSVKPFKLQTFYKWLAFLLSYYCSLMNRFVIFLIASTFHILFKIVLFMPR